MKMVRIAWQVVWAVLLANNIAYSQLPEGNVGIAHKYRGDQGIQNDPRVVFSESFEVESIEGFSPKWDMIRDPHTMSLSEDVPRLSSGKKSLLISQRSERGTGGDLYTRLPKGQSKLHSRFYVRFAEDCEPIHHFGTCVGGNRPATPWPEVRAGVPTRGDKSFWVGIEPFGESWRWDYYAYWHEMRGSPPRGQTWGNSFINDDAAIVKKGEWVCVEMMIKLNDVGSKNGEMAFWLDGKLISHLKEGEPRGIFVFDKFFPNREGEGVVWDSSVGERRVLPSEPGGSPFPGFDWRTTEDLEINFVWLYVYITKGTTGHVNNVWFDDVVLATDYIGPLE